MSRVNAIADAPRLLCFIIGYLFYLVSGIIVPGSYQS
jgi:hypothetical protein